MLTWHDGNIGELAGTCHTALSIVGYSAIPSGSVWWFQDRAATIPYLSPPGDRLVRLHHIWDRLTAGCIDTDLPAGRHNFGRSGKPLIEIAHVHHALWVTFTETRCKKPSEKPHEWASRLAIRRVMAT